jgi:ABC-type transport system substrate-binding protein
MSARNAMRARVSSLAFAALCFAGCGPTAPPASSWVWVVGAPEPRFDPDGPPDPVRWALERLLGQGLMDRDSSGMLRAAAAERYDITTDGLTYTFTLRPGLRFADGTACTSADFRRALESGLNRLDHASNAWLLSPIVGVDRVRAGRPLPPLGIATPDPRTLVLRLARADPTLLQKLAVPGVSSAWSLAHTADWQGGLGDYRLERAEPGRRMTLARRVRGGGPDTVRIVFAPEPARARRFLRTAEADLVWPIPPRLLVEPLPSGYRTTTLRAVPERRLMLVLRADLPPTSRPEARYALEHGLNGPDVLAALGPRGAPVGVWLAGAPPFDLPRHDAEEVRGWLERGKLGRSLHVVMAYDADGAAAEVARPLQTEWARLGLDVELRPLRGETLAREALGRSGAQLMLVESQALMDGPVAELADLVVPVRGGAIGTFRSGWTTREFDRWIGPQPPETALDAPAALNRIADEGIVLPLASLPWLWIERVSGSHPHGHPRFGPQSGSAGAPAPGLFQQSLGFLDKDGVRVRFDSVYSNAYPPPTRVKY